MDIIAFCKTKNTCMALHDLLTSELENSKVNTVFENELNGNIEVQNGKIVYSTRTDVNGNEIRYIDIDFYGLSGYCKYKIKMEDFKGYKSCKKEITLDACLRTDGHNPSAPPITKRQVLWFVSL